MLDQALFLLDKGIHPLKIASGFDKACDIACKYLDEIAGPVDIFEHDHENLIRTAMTALGSKIVSKCKRKLAEISVNAVLAVADLERRDVNFELIKMVTKTGGSIEDTKFVNGIGKFIQSYKIYSHRQGIFTSTNGKGSQRCQNLYLNMPI